MQLPPHDPLDTLGLAEGVEVRFKPNLRPDQQRLLGALGVHVIFDEDGYGPDSFTRLVAGAKTRREIVLGVLSDGEEHTSADLIEATGGDLYATNSGLSKMAKRGEIVRVRRGVYRNAP